MDTSLTVCKVIKNIVIKININQRSAIIRRAGPATIIIIVVTIFYPDFKGQKPKFPGIRPCTAGMWGKFYSKKFMVINLCLERILRGVVYD